jgi:hypothetical protein
VTKAQLEAKLAFLRKSIRRHLDAAKEAKKSEEAAKLELAHLKSYVASIDEAAVRALRSRVEKLEKGNADLLRENRQRGDLVKDLRAKLDHAESEREDLADELASRKWPRAMGAALDRVESWIEKLRDAMEDE